MFDQDSHFALYQTKKKHFNLEIITKYFFFTLKLFAESLVCASLKLCANLKSFIVCVLFSANSFVNTETCIFVGCAFFNVYTHATHYNTY